MNTNEAQQEALTKALENLLKHQGYMELPYREAIENLVRVGEGHKLRQAIETGNVYESDGVNSRIPKRHSRFRRFCVC